MQQGSTLAPHPYCTDCGLVRFVGSRRALNMGGLMNMLARFDRELRYQGRHLTEAQRRLIVKRLEALEADDTFALSREAQFAMVAETVAGYTGMSADVAAAYLHPA